MHPDIFQSLSIQRRSIYLIFCRNSHYSLTHGKFPRTSLLNALIYDIFDNDDHNSDDSDGDFNSERVLWKTKTKKKKKTKSEDNFDGNVDPDAESSARHLPQAVKDVLKLNLVILRIVRIFRIFMITSYYDDSYCEIEMVDDSNCSESGETAGQLLF